MKKLLIFIICVGLLIPFTTSAAYDDVTIDNTVLFELDTIEGPATTITVDGTSGPFYVESMLIETNYIEIDLLDNSVITLSAAANTYFQVSKSSGSDDYTISNDCPYSMVTLTGTGAATKLKVEVTSDKPSCPGGGGYTYYPTNPSVTINEGAECTSSLDVTLNLTAGNTASVLVTNNDNFTTEPWQIFEDPMDLDWTLTDGDGEKTVTVLYRSISNTYSLPLKASIEYNSSGCPGEEPEGQAPEEPTDLDKLVPGDLIKGYGDTVYYYGLDGKRYVFPSAGTYYSWYSDFYGIKLLTDNDLSSIPLGGNVTYKPGVRMIKFWSSPKVYAVEKNGTLRWVETEDLAAALYAENWADLIEDINVAFFINYTIGEPIDSVDDFNPQEVEEQVVDINDDLGL